MQLTTAQLIVVRNDIAADPVLLAYPNNPDGNIAIAGIYNAVVSPNFWVWRTYVTRDELVGATSMDGTTFSWTGAGYITRSQGERDAFNAIFDAGGGVNPSRANVRQAFLDIFSGAQDPAPANRIHMATICRRLASRIEKLFATGDGTTSAPGTMAYEGPVIYQDIERARYAQG